MIESDVSLDADGNAHTGPIEPDVKVMSRASGGAHSSDETIVTAEAWLLGHPACEGATTPAGVRTVRPVTLYPDAPRHSDHREAA